MASYDLLASIQTVQVLSSTVINDVVYCTIQTNPSGVIASLPVSVAAFNANAAAEQLTSFADNIETLMQQQGVVAATGEQTIDSNGLLTDNVTFTVQYVPPGSSSTSITASAVVPVGLLSEGGDPAIEAVLLPQAETIIRDVYANLKSAAGG